MTGLPRRNKIANSHHDLWAADKVNVLAWLRSHFRVGSESLHFVSSRLGTSFLVWMVVGIALALPAGLWILQVNMEEMTADWQGRPGLSVYFELDAKEAHQQGVVSYLLGQDVIAEVQFISADDALSDFKSYSGLNDALALLEDNPLPASLRARFGEAIDGANLEKLMKALQIQAGIAEVVVEKTWLERLNDISAIVSRLGAFLSLLFGVGAVLVTASSVRLAIESRLDELRVLKLVGATAGQIRRPFLYFGLIYGFGGAVIAAMLIAVIVAVIEGPLQSLFGSYQQHLNLAGFNPTFLTVLLGLGSVLGIVGAIVAVRQRLRDLELF